MITFTDEQKRIIKTARPKYGPLYVGASAGSGKTTLAVGICEEWDEGVYFTYTKSMQLEAEQKFRDAGIDTERVVPKTLHAYSLAASDMSLHTIRPSASVRWLLAQRNLWGRKEQQYMKDNRFLARYRAGVMLCQELGFGLPSHGPNDTLEIASREAIRSVLYHYGIRVYSRAHPEWNRYMSRSLAHWIHQYLTTRMRSGPIDSTIDFQDMLWLPLVQGKAFLRPTSFIWDEAQDGTPLRYYLIAKMVAQGKAAVLVGDAWQALFMYQGAKPNVGELFGLQFDAQEASLPVSFRVPLSNSDWVHHHLGATVEWGNDRRGSIERVHDFGKLLDWFDEHPEEVGRTLVLGRDKHRTGAFKDVFLEAFGDRFVLDYRANPRDRSDGVGAPVEGDFSYEDALAWCDYLDAQESIEPVEEPGAIRCMTIHRAKGLEARNVVIMGDPMDMAFERSNDAQWSIDQQRHMTYVAMTRAQHRTFIVLDEDLLDA